MARQARRTLPNVEVALGKFLICLAAIAHYPVHAATSPAKILADASRYTVKVQVQNEIAFNQDEGGSLSGTAFLIDRKRGWLLTNAHVATRSPSLVKVSFKGRDAIEAKRLHVDPVIDFAVLAVPVGSIPADAMDAPLACQKMPEAGTAVLAYGHPWGMSYTASRGIVSGLAWFYPNQLIQTDAVINSGNSGGPLINAEDGRVVGINTSTYKPESDNENATAVSLAEPLPAICKIVDLLRAGQDTRLRMLPLATSTSGDDLRPRVAEIHQSGLGFRTGDIIISVNGGRPVGTFPELLSELRGAGNQVSVAVERNGEQVMVVSPVRIIPDVLKARAINLSGLIIAEPWRLDDFEANPKGNLIVDWIELGEEAGQTDAAVSDQIVSIDGREFHAVEALYAYLEVLPTDALVDFTLKRASDSAELYREYRQIRLPRYSLSWVSN